MRKLLAGFALILSNAVIAAPVYLDCSLDTDEDGKKTFSVMVDESSGQVTHTVSTGFVYKVPGLFSANKIIYKKTNVYGSMSVSMQHEINRTTLEVSETMDARATDPDILKEIPPVITVYMGSCDISDTKDRKI